MVSPARGSGRSHRSGIRHGGSATPQTENTAPGVAIRVSPPELGFPGPVRVRDLWTHREIGTFRDEFAPEVPFHGTGLYRLSAAR